ncbi:hypothetical protein PTKIN_Ptkin03bG0196000 [Pterospermum kingtungense]
MTRMLFPIWSKRQRLANLLRCCSKKALPLQGVRVQARRLFNQIGEKNVIPWSALILRHAQEGNLAEAIELFRQLQNSSMQVDDFVLSSMIDVFADFALVEQGKQMHAYAVKVPSGLEASVFNSMVDMSLKCGMMDDAERL